VLTRGNYQLSIIHYQLMKGSSPFSGRNAPQTSRRELLTELCVSKTTGFSPLERSNLTLYFLVIN
ncbi:hypothetical protein ACP6PL_27260, partial [Dapis sp. BLCC M126]|uniref:hypothetical protein n=1 Tax=Dapis sp. BLCC M126 TaxID=3400189 RepID=UPI003CE83E88